jgi:hypothetical protein
VILESRSYLICTPLQGVARAEGVADRVEIAVVVSLRHARARR